MKKIAAVVFTFVLVFSLVACSQGSSSELITTPNQGFLVTPGIVCEFDGGVYDSFSYEVISYTGDKISVVEEAESIVRRWWNDDSTFRTPEIVWVTMISGDIKGFQDTGYIFLDPNTSYEDLLATTVHEWLHELVKPDTLIEMETGWGRPIMEYVVEDIAIELLQGIVEVEPSYYWIQLKNTEVSRNLNKLKQAFRNEKSVEAYEEIYGKDYMKIVSKIIIENM